MYDYRSDLLKVFATASAYLVPGPLSAGCKKATVH